MKNISNMPNSLVLRTDYSDESAWQAICASIEQPAKEFKAHINFVSNPEYAGITTEQVISLIPQGWNHTFIFIVDRTTMSDPEHPILVMDLYTELGRMFRVIPSEIGNIENNLSLANMDFEDFADTTDQEGIFRGFRRY
ncbi:MAG: hypothetical protein ABI947_28845 [Chloroflexota bacterium]